MYALIIDGGQKYVDGNNAYYYNENDPNSNVFID